MERYWLAGTCLVWQYTVRAWGHGHQGARILVTQNLGSLIDAGPIQFITAILKISEVCQVSEA